jgi:hypothetical protein
MHHEPRERGEALRPFPVAVCGPGWVCGVRTTTLKPPTPTLALPLPWKREGRVELHELAVPTTAAVTPRKIQLNYPCVPSAPRIFTSVARNSRSISQRFASAYLRFDDTGKSP